MALEQKFDRFPRPEFESEYAMPQLQDPLPRTDWWMVADVSLLALALAASALAVFRFPKQARRIQLANGGLCLLWFGFLRKGCICPIGSIQNTVSALTDPGYILPVLAIAFFVLPLAAALLRGRVFCGSVCPFGTIQELVNVRPIRVHPLANRLLGLLPPLFLVTAILAAGTGLGYLICRIDPFVGIFRWGAPVATALFAIVLLAVGIFVNRPYCRWICPYGWLLGCASRLAAKPPRVAGPDCTNCGLCGRACRVDAIRLPPLRSTPHVTAPPVAAVADTATDAEPEARPAPEVPQRGTPGGLPSELPGGLSGRLSRHLAAGLILAAFLGGGVLAGWAVGPFLASLHPDLVLATTLAREDAGLAPAGSTLASAAFRSSGEERASLAASARFNRERIVLAALFWGAGCGLVLGMSWWSARRQPRQAVPWSIDASRCVACGRCQAACPAAAKPRRPTNPKEKSHG